MMGRVWTVAVIAAGLPLVAGISACGGAAQAKTIPCKPTYAYSNVKNQGSALYVIDVETDHNGTSRGETFALSNTRTSSFAIEDSTVSVTRFRASIDVL